MRLATVIAVVSALLVTAVSLTTVRSHRDWRSRHRHGADDARQRRRALMCPQHCRLVARQLAHAQSAFRDLVDESDTRVVHMKVSVDNDSLLEERPYMGRSVAASEWVWASENVGRKLLGLPLDADVLSLYTLDSTRARMHVVADSAPPRCFLMLSPECRLRAARVLLVRNVTYREQRRHRRDLVCHRVIAASEAASARAQFVYRCCDTAAFHGGSEGCRVYTTYGRHVAGVLAVIDVIAVIFTLFSPVIVMRIKLAMKYDTFTKFFRASLKQGITGQRNYVIRISSRQLVNLADPKPFSLPRFLFRLIFHCYGEGRCCIHWWREWRHQPAACRRDACCGRCWLVYWRFISVVIIYPSVLYAAAALYAPKLQRYAVVVEQSRQLANMPELQLNVNLVGASLLPFYGPITSIWMLFSLVSFLYTVLLLSWPNNPLEGCLLRHQEATRKPHDRPGMLYDRMTRGYRSVLQKLAYGEFRTKRHFFHIRWVPWGVRRLVRFVVRLLVQVPVISICAALLAFDARLFRLRDGEDDAEETDRDEAEDSLQWSRPSPVVVCKFAATATIWTGFVLVLLGYCSAVFAMSEFVLNVAFFTLLGSVLHASTVLPWLAFIAALVYYANDALAGVNSDHSAILRLIDENSPRISAINDCGEAAFGGGDRAVKILKTHNLGAVKFIDGDNAEYVSKELYYNVCRDLRCGWSESLRRVSGRLAITVLFLLFVFLSLSALGSFTGSGLLITAAAIAASLLPKAVDHYVGRARRPRVRKRWARVIPEILDRHVRVDRTRCADDAEEELTTYDVRPVGVLEVSLPRVVQQRALRVWKFPWLVSVEQQTQSREPFVVALGNKLAAAAFLGKVVTHAYSADLDDEVVLRQWCLMVETCIMDGSAAAAGVNGVPIDPLALFPSDVRHLVSSFNTGDTIDNVVDAVNVQLYGPYTKGVLVTVGNTSVALCNLNGSILAFNAACHGDHVTDVFGAVLVATDFNTQNLQTVMKYMIDPYNPDSVPVYSIVPTEGFVFCSPDILEASPEGGEAEADD
ncbi:hypothetical protein LSAT2_019033 [Lamellibrachia satsuma]|nr:hypothetical protein LSAT2_019033 [Lamellibrachia satsuma]